MKEGELSTWLKSASRYAKITCLRINQDDDRRIALNASAKRFAAAEKVVADLPGVNIVEALDGNGNIVSTFVVAVPEVVQRDAEAIEKNDPQSPAGLMAAYARHISNAYREGGEQVTRAFASVLGEYTGLIRTISSRLERLETAHIRQLNAQAKVLERSQEPDDDDDGLGSFEDMFAHVIRQRALSEAGKAPQKQ